MKKNLPIFLTLLTSLYLFSCKQSHESVSDKYFRFLNNRQADSLQLLLTSDFKVTLTYTTYFYNRDDFFNTYLKIKRENNERTKIIKTIRDKEPKQFLVEDSSDYLKYLDVKSTTWIVTVKSKDDKISEVIMDTTERSRNFFNDVKEKANQFNAWLRNKYSYQYPGNLYDTAGLLLRRLREYKEDN